MKIIIALIFTLVFTSCITRMKIHVDIFDRAAFVNSKENEAIKSKSADCACLQFEHDKPNLARLALRVLKESTDSSFLLPLLKDLEIAKKDRPPVNYGDRASLELMSQSFADNLVSEVKKRACSNGILDKAKAHRVINEEFDNLIYSLISPEKNLTDNKKRQLASKMLGEDPVVSAKTAVINMIDALYGNSIADDPMASFVVKAPNSYWNKYPDTFDIINYDGKKMQPKTGQPARINSTRVSTFFGNADIAIKMEAPGYFVMKGVRLDANESIKASFKVLNQGIKYISYASGIPVPTPATPAGNTTNYVSKIPEIIENDTLAAIKDQMDKMYRIELKSFLSIVLSNKEKITADDAKAQSVVGDIKEAYSKFINTINQ